MKYEKINLNLIKIKKIIKMQMKNLKNKIIFQKV